PATEPPAPAAIASADELYVTGLHLEQYRHATRMPELYWREALRRDPGDARCNLALGRWHLRRGEFALAEKHLRASIARQTLRNPNPADGEAHYQLGLVLRYLGRDTDAYAALYKSTWNHAWQAPAYHALAEIDFARRDWSAALDHLDRALRVGTDNLKARNLKTLVLRQLGRADEAAALLAATRSLDPLDIGSAQLAGDAGAAAFGTAIQIDLAHDHARAGLFPEAIALLTAAARSPEPGTSPLIHYTLAWLHGLTGDAPARKRALAAARTASPDYCFPARLEDLVVLEAALAADPRDARAAYYLGNLLYDRRRQPEALALWEKSAKLDPTLPTVWRNLGIAYFNIAQKPAKARAAYERAVRAAPADARLLYERDQLWKRLGVAPAKRLRELLRHPALTRQRDDLAVELCALHNQTGDPAAALALLAVRKFQPWEGGEGLALGQHVRTHLAIGRASLSAARAATARHHFETALTAPENLGEARHLLANSSDIQFWLGEACAALGDKPAARAAWTVAATFKGDFQEMRVRAFSELTYYSALALARLGRAATAKKLLSDLLAYARDLAKQPATIDYFATSLPTMLLFDEDLAARQLTTARFIE
ncbi:MAG: tetratricopeptide repeat protein, partial [Burkholderiales bacterium]|nr:tetratricopeptide repeat protein [Opitutaceae bacterium]